MRTIRHYEESRYLFQRAQGSLCAPAPAAVWTDLDLIEEIRIDQLMNTLVARLGIHEPRCRGNATEQGIAVLRCKAEARDLMSIPHRQRWHGDHCLVENAPKESMIAAKGEDRVGHGFF